MKAIDIVGSDLKGDAIIPFLIEVEIEDFNFLRIKETLTRVGIPGVNTTGKPRIYQTCHILSKRGKYYICHFKMLFLLDGKENELSQGDIARQNLIAKLLQQWGLVKIVNPEVIGDDVCSMSKLKVAKYTERNQYEFISKYDVGACVRKAI